MSSRQAKDTRGPVQTIAEDAVAEYLMAHPDFFERQPELLARLRVPHASGQAVSLIEHQVNVLRQQLQAERRRLAHLIARARDFETLSARLHNLALLLMAADDLVQVRAVLGEVLCREFDAEAVTLKLFPLHADAPTRRTDPDPAVAAFLDFLGREQSLCGPLSEQQNRVLFGDERQSIRSVALVPVRAQDRCGVLAIGSGDPARFGTDMGTDLLDRLGEIVSQKLRLLQLSDG